MLLFIIEGLFGFTMALRKKQTSPKLVEVERVPETPVSEWRPCLSISLLWCTPNYRSERRLVRVRSALVVSGKMKSSYRPTRITTDKPERKLPYPPLFDGRDNKFAKTLYWAHSPVGIVKKPLLPVEADHSHMRDSRYLVRIRRRAPNTVTNGDYDKEKMEANAKVCYN